MIYENCYISSNCNQTPKAVHWGKNNLICYASCHSVMIYDPKFGSGGKITHCLVGHSKRVNSVKWLSGKNITWETEIISCAADNTLKVWSLKNGIYETATLEGHESTVNLLDGLYKDNDMRCTVVVSVGMDCTIKIWYRNNPTESFYLSQSINLDYHIGVGLAISYLPNCNEVILACALDNSKIYIYTESESDRIEFKPSTKLGRNEDWVRGLDMLVNDNSLLIATCSQDAVIRLWRVTSKPPPLYSFEEPQIKTQSESYYCILESVLTGHEGWIYSVNWSPRNLQLLSASIDKTMIIWEMDENSGLWMEKIRVGEVGGNTLGFYGGVFGPKGDSILAHSYHGAFHIWNFSEKLCGWTPSVTVGGHFLEVVDCAWEPKGEFLFSTGADQTTRVHAPWKREDHSVTWHEIARPQIHGYNINSIAVFSRYHFASGGDEKVIRIFEAPENFINNFRRICRISEGDSKVNNKKIAPKGASVPSLGLSNKAVFIDDNIEQASSVDKRNPYPEESHFTSTDFIEPPTEETLLQNTLWPETQKLYGHGYEVYSLATSPDGKYLASACKSNNPKHSAVLLWDTSNWKQMQKLLSHNLTVVQLQFSPDSNKLLSVSRDRRWSLFTKTEENKFEFAAATDKSTAVHTRIIWTCCWAHDSNYFATGSRDGKVAIWNYNESKEKSSALGKCGIASEPLLFGKKSITALAFAPGLVSGKYLLAVGLESGPIHLFSWSSKESKEVLVLSTSEAHYLTVKRLAFRPVFGRAGEKKCDENVLQLASCSADYSVKIYNIIIGNKAL